MENYRIIPLCNGSKILVRDPTIDFFYNKINNCEYFSSPRQAHGVWDSIYGASKNIPIVPNNFKLIAQRMSSKTGLGGPLRRWSISADMCYELLCFMHSSKPDNMIYAISDVAFYSTDLPPHHIDRNYQGGNMIGSRNGFRQRHNVMSSLLPHNDILYNAVMWRKYALKGELQNFIDFYKDRKIVTIGPWYFKDFHIRTNLQNYEFIEIDYFKAAEQYQQIYEKVLQHKYDDAIYFIVGGAVANWLTFKMHETFSKSYIIDIGRALDIYYKEMAVKMGWVWILMLKNHSKRNFY